jgi:hypothetical protein
MLNLSRNLDMSFFGKGKMISKKESRKLGYNQCVEKII